MRAFITAAVSLSALAGAAAAQTGGAAPQPKPPSSPPATTGSGVPDAPVGHRQPTQESLPPAVRQDERSLPRAPVDPLGPLPQICRQC